MLVLFIFPRMLYLSFLCPQAALRQSCETLTLQLPWLETFDSINKQAPLAPEMASQMMEQEERRANQLKNNRKLPQIDPAKDPILNDFKREMLFHRQAQAAIMDALPKLHAAGILTKR